MPKHTSPQATTSSEPKQRKGAPYGGPSRGEGKAPEADKPLKDAATTTHATPKAAHTGWAGYGKRRALRAAVDGVDEELYGHLLRKFAFVPRTSELLVVMSRTAQAFFKGFDCSEVSEMDLYKRTVRTIALAMDIPEEEEQCRQHLKSGAQAEAREKHAKFVAEGKAGHKGLFGGMMSLPHRPKTGP